MTRQDLLEERGASARHANDEDRVGSFASVSCAVPEELARERLPEARDALRVELRVVGMPGAVQRIALRVVLEGTRVISGVLAGLAEREVELQPFLRVDLGTRDLRLHRGKIPCVE